MKKHIAVSFKEVTGKERYTITDRVTGGVNWADDKKEMLMYVYYIGCRLGHELSVYDKVENTWANYVPGAEVTR